MWTWRLKLGESAYHVSFGPPGKIPSDRIGVPKSRQRTYFWGEKQENQSTLSEGGAASDEAPARGGVAHEQRCNGSFVLDGQRRHEALAAPLVPNRRTPRRRACGSCAAWAASAARRTCTGTRPTSGTAAASSWRSTTSRARSWARDPTPSSAPCAGGATARGSRRSASASASRSATTTCSGPRRRSKKSGARSRSCGSSAARAGASGSWASSRRRTRS